jgi:hypothetical protein
MNIPVLHPPELVKQIKNGTDNRIFHVKFCNVIDMAVVMGF